MQTFTHIKQQPATRIRRKPSSVRSLPDAQRVQVQNILRKPVIQTKLTIGAPDDVYEKEADRVADAVMRMPDAVADDHTTIGTQPVPVIQRLQNYRGLTLMALT